MNTENNKLIAEFGKYRICSDGTVIGQSGKVLKLHKGTGGYLQLNAWTNGKQKTYLVHRLVAELFIHNPENKPEVNHKDGDKLNNRVGNLEWVTRSENIVHGIDSGLIPSPWEGKSGEAHPTSKAVLQLDAAGNLMNVYGSAREAARLSGVNYGTISNVLIGKGKTAGGFIWKYK